MAHIFKRILIAVDRSEPSAWAVRVGFSMATELGAEVLLVHVVNHPPARNGTNSASHIKLLADLRRKGRSLLKKMQAFGAGPVAIGQALREGVPAEEILAAAINWGAHLIVIGAYAQSNLGNLLLGNTAETVARRASCPVVTVGDKPEKSRRLHQ